jgi:hypothetical protein
MKCQTSKLKKKLKFNLVKKGKICFLMKFSYLFFFLELSSKLSKAIFKIRKIKFSWFKKYSSFSEEIFT